MRPHVRWGAAVNKEQNMAYDEGLAELFRGDLVDMAGLTEKRMFGGLAFLLDGNMLCGVHPGGGMVRVGKANDAAALAMDGVSRMAFTGRPMAGWVDVAAETLVDDDARAALLALALGFVRTLPAK
jgi:hypothetical protein